MRAGRIPDDGFLPLASAPYVEIGVDLARAELKSRFLSQFAAEVIRTEHPELASKMFMQTAVLTPSLQPSVIISRFYVTCSA
ncbi:MAG: hypothetical protein ACYCTW_02040 [Sulfuricella sp.]